MAVPGHDERDHEFATKFSIDIKRVVEGGDKDIKEEAFSGSGKLVNSDFLNGLGKTDAISKMGEWLEEKSLGKRTTTYKLRDWLFSRQRYWGEPFPVVLDKDGNDIAVDESELPIILQTWRNSSQQVMVIHHLQEQLNG